MSRGRSPFDNLSLAAWTDKRHKLFQAHGAVSVGVEHGNALHHLLL